MTYFAYAALDSRGKTVKGHVEAASRNAAIGRLRGQGLTPIEIAQAKQGSPREKTDSQPFWKKKISFGKRASKAAVAAMTRQLATLLQAGLPLDRALYAIYSGDASSPVSSIVASLHENILGGNDLAKGLAAWPGVFSTTFVAMVHAGETSGTLDLVMERLASHLEQEVAMRRKIKSALAYPVLMMAVGIAVVIFLLSFVIPQVTKIFADMGRELPLPTRILLAISDGFRDWWWLIAAVIALIAISLWRLAKTPKGRKFFQTRMFSLPIFGRLYARTQLANMTRTLGMLLKNGVPLLKALRIVKAASPNVIVTDSVQAMVDGVQAGKDLSSFMNNDAIYPPIARQMTAAGEKGGRLAEMLLWVANDAENHVESSLQTLTSLLEPVMILILGGLVGFVVIAIILPIFEMSSLAG